VILIGVLFPFSYNFTNFSDLCNYFPLIFIECFFELNFEIFHVLLGDKFCFHKANVIFG
jgi:hypothetical protein